MINVRIQKKLDSFATGFAPQRFSRRGRTRLFLFFFLCAVAEIPPLQGCGYLAVVAGRKLTSFRGADGADALQGIGQQ